MIFTLRHWKNRSKSQLPKTILLAAVGAIGIFTWTMPPLSSPAVAFSLTSSADPQTFTKTGFEHESTDLIADVLYLRPSSTYRDMATSGAYRINQGYALGETDEWYIEEQRFGADALISGLVHNDLQAIEAGLKIFDWGFAQQQADGSFGNTGDAFHSTSLFVQSVAYALLTLQESPLGAQYEDVIASYAPKLQNAARWMIQEDVWQPGLNTVEPFTHRYYIIGTALGLTGKLSDDQTLINHADQVINIGLSKQQDNGVNPEKGGHDSSYQMAGALYAMRWLTHFSTDPLALDVANMLDQALLWEDSVILETGQISGDGNTRTEGGFLSRLGTPKAINHREVVHGFAYWFSMTNERLWESNAVQVAQYYYANDERVMFTLEEIQNSLNEADATTDYTSDSTSQSVPESSYPLGILVSGILCYLFMRKPLRF